MKLTDIAEGLTDDIAQVAPAPEQMPALKFRLDKIRGWLEIGQFYSCIPDTVYPWDPTVMKAIWEHAPDAVPMWVQWVFHTPPEDSESGIVIYGRHAIGRRIWHPRTEPIGFRCLMPTMPCQGLTFEKPNKIWFIHTGSDNPLSRDLPGTFLGFDDTILDRVKRSALGFQMTDAEYQAHLKEELIEGPRKRLEKKQKALDEEMSYAQADLERYAAKQLERVSDVEIMEYTRSAGKRKKDPKPMVVVP